MLIISGDDVARLTEAISADALINMIGKTMHAIWADNHRASDKSEVPPIQNPLRVATETDRHTILYMPARLTTTASGSQTSCKIVAAPKPGAPVFGLPATTLLFDEGTGAVKAVVKADELTGIRTAAASALATKLLADPNSSHVVVFGTGTQSLWHARLILQLFPLVTSLVFVARSRSQRAEQLASQCKAEFPGVNVELVTAEKTAEVVKLADIICCCVPSTSPVFSADDLKEGVHINAIGSYKPSMQEFPPALLSQSNSLHPTIPRILVDSREACLAESGELIASGIPASSILELGEVVDINGDKIDNFDSLGLRASGRSLFKCVGIGGMDVAVTELVYKLAVEKHLGTTVAF